MGINTLGSRNTALKELVAQVPAPLVAEMLGYSDQVTQKHAADAGNTWAAYASTAPERSSVIPPRQQPQPVPHFAHADNGDQLTLDLTDDDIDDGAPPASPVQALLDALDGAADTVTQARAAVTAAEEELAQAVLHAYRSGFTWTRIAARLGISPQAAHQRWAARARNPAEHDRPGNAHDTQDP
ncbi:hypothetical protein B7435_07400 [Mycolicibacterium peregrinum]|nr:hypothetical protein [Mycobacterium sp. WUMAC-067]MCA2316288.1 hypothetical protein [Mycobacterium sp. WUMAC-025]MCV7200620.1 hypothetical protein [Mycolicibacterium peregrinum]OWM07424.1 hypothetical protein B7435_07400 [Mycolicibacterium peregrinum]TMS55407.1 hypothetical protein E0T84_03780 [Mycobacterium sp. DBP42]